MMIDEQPVESKIRQMMTELMNFKVSTLPGEFLQIKSSLLI